MVPAEILRKVRRIELTTRHLVNTLFSGEYHSVFKGQGMAFAEVREYQAGDDVRQLDWNVTARMGHPFVKVFDEERELTVMLMVDASGSGDFGSAERMKGEVGVELCALLAFSAIQNNDRVGLIIFTDRVEAFIPPKKGRKHVLRVIRELLYFRPARTGTDIGGALDYLNRVSTRRSVVFLVSDLVADGFERALKVAARRHDLTAMVLYDPRERALPDVGMVSLEDAETGESLLVDTADPELRTFFARQAEEARAERLRVLRSIDVDAVELSAATSYVEPLVRYFRRRAQKLRA